jgi:Neuraminidase (sialidase)
MGSKTPPGDVQTVYVGPNDTARIKCPNCGTSRSLDVRKFKGRKDPLKLLCKCKSSSQIFLEFRKSFRRTTNLEGIYTLLARSDERGKIFVKNLSKKGIGFTTFSDHKLSQEDEIQVVFTLDDQKKSKIEKNAVVRNTNGNYVGCEFTGKDHHDTALGFYLMS